MIIKSVTLGIDLMKAEQVSQQNFKGTVQVLGELGSEQSKTLEKMLPKINDLIKDQQFDLFIKRTSFGETVVGTDINSGYVINTDNDFYKASLLAVKDKLKGSYLIKTIRALKNALNECHFQEDTKHEY